MNCTSLFFVIILLESIEENIMSITLGVSVYPEQETIEQIDAYLKLASSYGFTKVFTSMFSIEGDKDEVTQYFKNFTGIAHQYGMKVSGDCNTKFLEKMGADESNLSIFNEMGIDSIRMDLCYFDERDKKLINNTYNIGVEMSGAFIKPIDEAIARGANIDNLVCCHNFYPERYTGADLESVMNVNNHWKEKGVKVAQFISSNVEGAHGPWPIQEGLPTMEDHRWMSVDDQVRHCLAMGNVDEIIFGNAFASKEEFEAIQRVMNLVYVNIPKKEGIGPFADYIPHGELKRIPFKIEMAEGVTDLEKEILYYEAHTAGEYLYYMIRDRWTRILYHNTSIPCRKNDKEMYHRGDVVIVNDNCKHYHGELHIVLKDTPNDNQKNYIGHIPADEMCLLEHFKSGTAFCFEKE